jgi:hypothetical protein
LQGAVTGYQAFSTVGNGNTCYYTIADQNGANWEVGIGTYSSAGNTLARTTVLSSSNAGSLTNFSSGTQNVFLTYPSERSVNLSSSALTSGRVTYATTDGLLTDSSNFTYGTGLTVNGLSQVYQTGLYTVDGTLSNYSATNGFYLNGNATGWLTLRGDGTGTNYIQINGSSYGEPNLQRFFTASTERMRITAAGNIGIGAGSPTQKLTVVDATVSATVSASFANSNNGVYIRNSGSTTSYVGDSTGANNAIAFDTSNYVAILTNGGTERMRIDASGNVGIGVTPSAWSGYRAMQLGSTTSLWSGLTAGSNASSFYTNNGYFNGTNRIYLTTGFASEYIMGAGSHYWYTAPSGTAGNAITFTQAMTLTQAGNLGIGTTSPAYTLDVVGRARMGIAGSVPALTLVSGSNNSADVFVSNNTTGLRLVGGTVIGTDSQILLGGSASGTVTNIYFDGATKNFRDTSGGTTQMVIDTGGNVGIGTTSITQRLTVVDTNPILVTLKSDSTSGAGIYIDNSGRASGKRYGIIVGNVANGAFSIKDETASVNRLVIDTNGNVIVGGLTTPFNSTGRGNITINGTSNAILGFTVGDADRGYIYHDNSALVIQNSVAGILQFNTSAAERMRIDSSGNVGIGTSSPANKLQVSGSIYIVESTSNFLKFSSDGYKYLVSSTNAGDYLSMACNPASLGMQFGKSTVSAPATFVPLMTIRVSGNVGIGTDGPEYPLDVQNSSATRQARFYRGGTAATSAILIQNSATGTTSSDGLMVGVNSSGEAIFNNQENLASIFYTNDTERMRITSAGIVGIGTSSPNASYKLNLSGTDTVFPAVYFNNTTSSKDYSLRVSGTDFILRDNTSGNDRLSVDTSGSLFALTGVICFTTSQYRSNVASSQLQFINNSAGVSLAVNGTSWGSLSDERDKEIIEPITDALDKVKTLRTVIGKYKIDEEGTRRSFLIAQDVKDVLPEAVTELEDDKNTLILQYTETIPLLVAAIKELKAEFDAYKATHP